MVLTSVKPCVLLEVAVMFLQVAGVAALCFNRLFPTSRWSDAARVVFVLDLCGLGFAGALCGRADSEFALFAGATMTALLIGMNLGTGRIDAGAIPGRRPAAEPALAG